jgi:predicted NAD/FAD-binding protein
MLRFPVATMIRFCHNHGLIQVQNRPQWHRGGRGAPVRAAIVQGLDARLNTPVSASSATRRRAHPRGPPSI